MALDLVLLAGFTALAIVSAALFCRRCGPGVRLSWWTAAACVGLASLSAAWGMESQRRAMLRLREAYEGFAPTYALEAARLGHARVGLETAPDDPTYLAIVERQRRWLALNPAVADIYTFRVIDGENVLIVDSETDYDRDGRFEGEREARTLIGESFGESGPDERAAMAGERVFNDTVYSDRWGWWVSAYAPIVDESGREEAVLGVDIAAASWLASLAAARRGALAAGALCVIVVLAGRVAHGARGHALRQSQAAAREMAEAKRMAEVSAAAKSEFLANMSHEIRTPLTAVLGYAEMLEEEGESPERRAECVATIRGAGRHLLAIINDILDLSKIDAGRMEVERTATSLADALREVVSLLGPRAAAKGVGLEVAFATPVPDRVMTDPTRLRQVLLNLVGNATKFTERGRVRVVVGRENGSGDERLVIDIEDSGPGMTEEATRRLFEPFAQADGTVTRRHGGTGLGLVISRRLAGLMGGEVTLARTAPGEGSCFRVDLPLTPAPGAVSMRSLTGAIVAAPEAVAPPRLPGMRVLLAEDGPENQRLIEHYLTRAGAVVVIASNGREALEAMDRAEASGKAFELVLTDMQMPQMDGYALAGEIRRRGVRTPIIALTAHAMADDRRRCLEAGCDAYLTKPIDRAALVRECAEVVRRGAGRAAA